MKLWNFNWFCKIHGKNQNQPKFCFNKFLCRIRFFAVSIVKALVPAGPMFLPLKFSFLLTLNKNPPRAIIVLKVELAERGTRWKIFICFAIFSGIRGKLFWSSICSIKFSPLKCSFLLILYEKSTLNDHGFTRWAWHSGKFFYLCCLHYGYLEKVVLKVQKFLWTNFFTTEMFNSLILLEKSTLTDHSFRRWAWHLTFIDSFLFATGIRGKILYNKIFGKIWAIPFS